MLDNEDDYYSLEEAKAYLQSLTNEEYLQLAQLARMWSKSVPGMDPVELVNEGICRVAEGRRRWPRGVDFARFFHQEFRSIANAERKSRAREVSDGDPVGSNSDAEFGDSEVVQGTGNVTSDPEASVYAERVFSGVMEALAGDQDALAIAMGRAEGKTEREICETFNLDQSRYGAGRKRLARTLLKMPRLELSE